MPRKAVILKREILPDPKYKTELVTKFINRIMQSGKKNLAQSILYNAFDIIQEKTKEDPLSLFQKAIENVKPVVEVRSRRVGGSTYQVPIEVRYLRRTTLGIRWILIYAKQRGEKGMASKLAGELIDASKGRGGAFKKKEDTHRMAEANKAFAHYRW
ncbi:MAG: 30S ribosomal protein S7 [Desulfobacteraceae bacterium]|jgi:small subunit ribosomal protein S7|uniref:Small ribosomal subunit protein uS7 domain-containing protein n=1 Tax=marine sediment metagenome TaxID=412755 RepID=X0SWL1_9ZZZZ|nr:MAG: 30S ribosomal protein S7 [Desulfobacteraceae bacterium]